MKKISLLLLVLVLTLAFSGCTQPEQQVGETVKVTDLAGR